MCTPSYKRGIHLVDGIMRKSLSASSILNSNYPTTSIRLNLSQSKVRFRFMRPYQDSSLPAAYSTAQHAANSQSEKYIYTSIYIYMQNIFALWLLFSSTATSVLSDNKERFRLQVKHNQKNVHKKTRRAKQQGKKMEGNTRICVKINYGRKPSR